MREVFPLDSQLMMFADHCTADASRWASRSRVALVFSTPTSQFLLSASKSILRYIDGAY